jgi:hypothetical protein
MLFIAIKHRESWDAINSVVGGVKTTPRVEHLSQPVIFFFVNIARS